jgi:hypothetical protein
MTSAVLPDMSARCSPRYGDRGIRPFGESSRQPGDGRLSSTARMQAHGRSCQGPRSEGLEKTRLRDVGCGRVPEPVGIVSDSPRISPLRILL